MVFRLQHSAWDQNPNHVPRSLILLPPSPHSLLGAVRWETLGTRLPESLIDTHTCKQLFHMGEPQALSMNNTLVHVPVARLGLSSSAENSFSTSWYFSSLMFFWLGLWTSGSSVYLSCQKLHVLYECLQQSLYKYMFVHWLHTCLTFYQPYVIITVKSEVQNPSWQFP